MHSLTKGRTFLDIPSSGHALLTVSFLAAVVLGWGVVQDDRILGIVIIAFFGLVILRWQWLWVPALTIFGLVALNATGITPLKVAFFTLIGLISIGAFLWFARSRQSVLAAWSAPLLHSSTAFLILWALSLPISLSSGTTVSAWARDSTPYLLFALVPFLAIALRDTVPSRVLQPLFVVTAGLGALSYVTTWAENRHYIDTPLPDHLFASGGSLFALYYFAVSKVLVSRENWRWALLLAVLLMGLIFTGNRSALVHLAAFGSIPLLAVSGTNVTLGRMAGRLVGGLVSVGLAVLAAIWITGLNPDAILRRYGSIASLFSRDSADASLEIRTQFTRVAWRIFKERPFLGAGPGFDIQEYWIASGASEIGIDGILQIPRVIYDSPLAFPATMGTVGVVLLAFTGRAYWSFARRASRIETTRIAGYALSGWLVTMLLSLIFSAPIEDKSLAFGLFLLVGMAMPESHLTQESSAINPPHAA